MASIRLPSKYWLLFLWADGPSLTRPRHRYHPPCLTRRSRLLNPPSVSTSRSRIVSRGDLLCKLGMDASGDAWTPTGCWLSVSYVVEVTWDIGTACWRKQWQCLYCACCLSYIKTRDNLNTRTIRFSCNNFFILTHRTLAGALEIRLTNR